MEGEGDVERIIVFDACDGSVPRKCLAETLRCLGAGLIVALLKLRSFHGCTFMPPSGLFCALWVDGKSCELMKG